MFSFSFTMSEQQHRQWTPYKHAAPALTGAASLVSSRQQCFAEAELCPEESPHASVRQTSSSQR